MLELYFAATPHAQRALIAIEECALAYTLHVLDLHKAEQTTAAFRGVNPLQAVPVVVDPDGPGGRRVSLTQSIAICLYLAEKCGRLIPKDASARIEAFKWTMLAGSDVAGTNTAINQLRRSAPDRSEPNIAFFEDRLLNYLSACDARLEDLEYLAGEFSLADVCLYPFAAARRELIERQTDLRNLQAWMLRMASRPAVSKAMSAGF